MKKVLVFLILMLYVFAIVGFAMAENNNSNSTEDDDEINETHDNSDDSQDNVTDDDSDNSQDNDAVNESDDDEDDKDSGVGERHRIKAELHERNRLRINQSELPEGCSVTGVVLKCNLESGRVMAVFAGKSGNIILQVKGVNASTKVQLYKENDSFYGDLGDNETVLINYFPDQVREMIRNRLHSNVSEEQIELDEQGIYRVETRKRARLFYLVPVREKVRAQVDPETGEIIRIRNPWWGFLAKDTEENSSE